MKRNGEKESGFNEECEEKWWREMEKNNLWFNADLSLRFITSLVCFVLIQFVQQKVQAKISLSNITMYWPKCQKRIANALHSWWVAFVFCCTAGHWSKERRWHVFRVVQWPFVESQDAKKYDLVGDAFQVTGKLANVRTSALLSYWLMFPVNVFSCFTILCRDVIT